MQQAVTEVACGSAEHGVHVVRREGDVPDLDVLEVRGVAADLLDHPVGHLVLEVAVLITRSLDREGVRVGAGGVHAGRRHGRVVHRRDLHAQRRVVRDDAAAGVLPLPLLFFGGAEDADRRLHAGFVEELVRRRELRQAVEREVHLDERGAVIAALEPVQQLSRDMIGANKFGQGGVGGEVGYDDGCGDGFAVVGAHAGDLPAVDEDLLGLGAVADLAAAALEHLA